MEEKSSATLFLECKDKDNYLRETFDGAEPENYKQNLDWDDIDNDALEDPLKAKKLLEPLNKKFSDYLFELAGSGYRPNLSIISKALKRKYNAMDKPYTWDDVAEATGMWMDTALHGPWRLTERQYRDAIEFAGIVNKEFDNRNEREKNDKPGKETN